MNPHLQLQLPLPICLPLIMGIAVLSLLPAVASVIAQPGCQATCGNVSVPFPFGIGGNCSLDSRYEIECKLLPDSNSSIKPFLSQFNVEVEKMVVVGDQILVVRVPPSKVCTTDTQRKRLSSLDLRGSPYNFSTDGHVFIMEGCAGSAVLVNQTEDIMGGCTTACLNNNNTALISRKKCYGVECCQTQLPSTETTWSSNVSYSPLQFYHMDFYGQSSGGNQNCMEAALIKNDSLNQYIGNSSNLNASTVPIVLYWSWISSLAPHYNPLEAKCYRVEATNSTRCVCNNQTIYITDYGNPYVYNGCQGITYDTPFINPNSAKNAPKFNVSLYFLLFIAIAPLLLFFVYRGLSRFIKMRRKTEQRVKFFKLKLQQHQSSNGNNVVERTKLFSLKELDTATNHFNENRILGKGGQGTVYKGMLVDGRIVAVKKSKLMNEIQIEQFINEVVILSQLNHRNVVKLLGCCLEAEVPLLAYEFIPNGTLFQHIHEPCEDFLLSWPMRLKVAAGSAGAIAYLHSSSSTPVYHRDIKSANILLDDKHRAKVSDFGSSKTIEIDQTHLTTAVQGTFGYLDPEYFESYVFTEKSDVYSFGVVLLELLTSKKPIYRTVTMEQKSLVSEFFLHAQSYGLSNILDPEVVKEAKEEELLAVVDLAKRSLNGSGRLRPTMKEVAMTLEMIIKPPSETSTQNQQSFPNQEFGEIVMLETSDAMFMSSPLAPKPLYIGVQPLPRDTI